MTWFRVDDGFGDHPKVDALGDGPCRDAAIALWTLAGAWAARHLTDGYVSAGRVERIGVRNPIKAAAELVRVGLWDATDDGYQFRNWCEYQPTRAKVEAERGKTADRVRRFRTANDAPTTDAVTRESHRDDEPCNGVTSALVTPPPSRPVPTRPDPVPKAETLSARELESVLTRNDPKPTPQGPHSAAAEMAAEMCATFKRLTGRAWTSPADLLDALHGHGALVRSPMPDQVRAMVAHLSTEPEPIQAARRAMEAWAADPWVKANRFPMAHLAKDPLKYLTRPVSVSGVDNFDHASEEGPDFG